MSHSMHSFSESRPERPCAQILLNPHLTEMDVVATSPRVQVEKLRLRVTSAQEGAQLTRAGAGVARGRVPSRPLGLPPER